LEFCAGIKTLVGHAVATGLHHAWAAVTAGINQELIETGQTDLMDSSLSVSSKLGSPAWAGRLLPSSGHCTGGVGPTPSFPGII